MLMAMTMHDAEVLHAYASDLMKRNGPHASQIKGVGLALLGGIIWRADAGTIELNKSAQPTMALEVEVDGHGYVFADNYATGEIEMRRRHHGGPPMHSFSNDTPVGYVQLVFRGL
jgi:hypothetical protein